MPVGAYGGKREIMDFVSPVGPVYQAGTLSGNPVAMAAGLAMLSQIKEDQTLYSDLALITAKLENGLQEGLDNLGLPYTINRIGSMISIFFTSEKVSNFEDAKKSDLNLFGQYFREMLKRGVYLPPSQFESWFISKSITPNLVDRIVEASNESLRVIHQ